MNNEPMGNWPGFIQALGRPVSSVAVHDILAALGEDAVVSETPDIFNDSQGRTMFYKFIVSGLEFGFRAEMLNHIHVFVQSHEGYSAYKADMLNRSAQAWNRDDIVSHLGPAQDEAPSKSDALIGHTQAWVRYEFDTYDLRMEFSDDGHLWKATLMGKLMGGTAAIEVGATSNSASGSMALGVVPRARSRNSFDDPLPYALQAGAPQS